NEALKTKSPPNASRMPRAMRHTCSSLSITQGPAINTSGQPGPNAPNSIAMGVRGFRAILAPGAQPPLPEFVSRADKRLEQRMRLHRLGLELGMELAAQIPRVVGDLANLDVSVIGRLAGEAQAARLQPVFVLTVELIAMAVALVDFARAVRAVGEARFHQLAG